MPEESERYMKACADQTRCSVPRRYAVLGTDGYGRSETRAELREFFEIPLLIAVAALKAPADEGGVPCLLVENARRGCRRCERLIVGCG